jgi:hypothetical protein
VRLLPLFFVIIRARELRIKSCNELAELLADAVGGGAGRQAVNRADLTCKALTGHCRVFLEITKVSVSARSDFYLSRPFRVLFRGDWLAFSSRFQAHHPGIQAPHRLRLMAHHEHGQVALPVLPDEFIHHDRLP